MALEKSAIRCVGIWESETPDHIQRKLRDENNSCGSQPAYISMIIRRY
jgi:hypothetical protein